MMRRWIVVAVAGLALVTLGFSLGVMSVSSGRPVANVSTLVRDLQPSPRNADFTLFQDVWQTIHKTYVNTNINDAQLLQGALSGLVGGLGDPYSVYFAPAEAQDFQDEVEGIFQGVGMEVGFKDKQLTVIAPLPDSPAAQAGLRSGDLLLSIDQKSTDGLSLDQAVKAIRGPQGTTVVLVIRHADEKENRTISIIRKTIKVNSVRSKTLTVNGHQVLQLTVSSFAKDTGQGIQQAVRAAVTAHVDGIILDLRDNPGGYLDQSVTAASVFLSDGVVVSEVARDGQRRDERVDGPAIWPTQPLVVLVDGGSASAAEILAGALQDHRRARLIGQTTFGKGSVQDYEQLNDGSSLKLTVAHWLTPNGHSISDHGITPDQLVEITQDDVSQHRDPQLTAAEQALFPNP